MRVPADEAVLGELLAVVGGEDDQGVVVEVVLFQIVEETPQGMVHRADLGVVGRFDVLDVGGGYLLAVIVDLA